jgi:hypothetical protein
MTILEPMIKELKTTFPDLKNDEFEFSSLNKVVDGFLCPLINGSES